MSAHADDGDSGGAADPTPLGRAQAVLTQLDQLHVLDASNAELALELFSKGNEALDATRRETAAEVTPATTAATAPDKTARDADKAAAAQRRFRECQLAFVRAELHRRAALALPSDHAQRTPTMEKALAEYKAMRLEYRDLSLGALGYAGEARVHRAMGRLDEADAVLESVTIAADDRRIAQQVPAVIQLQRLFWLERLETAFARGIAEGRAMADRILNSPLMTDASPAERAAVQWQALRADVTTLTDGVADAATIASKIRDAGIAGSIPEHQRLAVLFKLRGEPGGTLTVGEQVRWAHLQAWAGLREAAVETYAGAANAAPDQMSPDEWQAYGSLLYDLGRMEHAAEALSRALGSAQSAEQRVAILRSIAAGRLHAARQPSADEVKRQAAIEALWQLVEASTEPAIRREALRSWVHLRQEGGTLYEHLALLSKYQEDISEDPYLCFMVAQSRWRAARGSASATAPETNHRASLAREVRGDLERILSRADAQLAPSIVLLLVQTVAADPNGGGTRGAFDVLSKHEPNLRPDAPAMPALSATKLHLLMELGLTTEAETLAAKIPPTQLPTATALRLAGLVASRYGQTEGASQDRADLRARVVQWVAQGLAGHGGESTYRQAALEGVRTLMKVEAYADAENILNGVRTGGGAADPHVALLVAESLQGQGKIESAQQLLADVVRSHPNLGEAHLTRGRLEQRLEQWQAAADAYRAAREHLPAGREPWWQATVGLAESLIEQGHAQAANEVVRVASALYRNGAPATMRPRIDALLKQPTPGASGTRAAAGNG